MKALFILLITSGLSFYLHVANTVCQNTGIASNTSYFEKSKKDLDIQAHQGGCGLQPCNTITAFKNAVKLGVNTLELDCVISSDKKVVISHDQFMNYTMLTPEGAKISKEEQLKYNIYKMNYDSIRKYDAGSRFNPEFPEQLKLKTYKPLLEEVIDSVETFIKINHLKSVRYNIEIKSLRGDNLYHPAPAEFTDLVIKVLVEKKLQKKVMIQSFDVRALQYLHNRYPTFAISYLVGKNNPNMQENLNKLGFVPNVYSPEFVMVSQAMVVESHNSGMSIIPWTVDKQEDMTALINMGVDGIITNYPNIALQIQTSQKNNQ